MDTCAAQPGMALRSFGGQRKDVVRATRLGRYDLLEFDKYE
jgi:hypothetical protein